MNEATGKISDVHIEESPIDSHKLNIWADKGMEKTIKSVEGVLYCYADFGKYHVEIDKRYNPYIVRINIIKAISEKINKERN